MKQQRQQKKRALVKQNFFDRAVAKLDPVRGLERLQARARLNAITSFPVRRTGGGFRGTLSNWFPRREGRFSEKYSRETLADRAEDLAANDPHAASIIDSMAINTVGTGLTPQARPNTKVLGWSEDAAAEFQHQAEWSFSVFSREADAAGRLPFWAIQLLSCYSLLNRGEFLRLPVMVDRPWRTFSLALQGVDPLRLRTPPGNNRADIRDGVEFGGLGEPTAYWIANPTGEYGIYSLDSAEHVRKPAMIGHRPGAFHVYLAKREEQVRGEPVLAPAMKFFKDLSDYLDFELVGAIIAASFPVWIESEDPTEAAGGLNPANNTEEQWPRYQEVAAGQVLYGGRTKPHVLKSDRPSNTFAAFVERILRAAGAAAGMPYEVVAKDFSKTNYSSARAALLEAWRVFRVYQRWLIDLFCQPVWQMVLEEAWLRGMIVLPKGSPDWYEAWPAYTQALWIPPKRGHVDPVKEIDAATTAIEYNILTLADYIAEMGADWEGQLTQRARERRIERKDDINPPAFGRQSEAKNGRQYEPPEPVPPGFGGVTHA